MKTTNFKLNHLKDQINKGKIKIMIMGLGSVGSYLLDYIVSRNDESIEVVVVGRNYDKMISDTNIIKVAGLIREQVKSKVTIESDIDFNNVNQLTECIQKHTPDFIVNTSRVYSGLKYGSISWNNLRAYGIWAPLAIKYIKNISEACDNADSDAILINTSYSDAVINWLKSAGKNYPDFGSGNLNHLIPRIKYAVAKELNITDFWNVKVTLATSHFHDVVISKEGQLEGIKQLLYVEYNGVSVDIDQDNIFKQCKIAMPVDSKRNMMNASSNYDIIFKIIGAIKEGNIKWFESPGALGEIGGYPIAIDARNNEVKAYIDETHFTLEEMRNKNMESIYLDGIESIADGKLIYTDALIQKVKTVFGEQLVKEVTFDNLDQTTDFLIEKIIKHTF